MGYGFFILWEEMDEGNYHTNGGKITDHGGAMGRHLGLKSGGHARGRKIWL